MVVRTVRKSLLAVLMALTIMAGLITGFTHTKGAAMAQTSNIRTTHVQVKDWCPPPPIVC